MANLYLVKRTDYIDYDQYDGIVVCCETEEDALKQDPTANEYAPSWTKNPRVVTYLGIADASIPVDSIVLASYNAG